MVLPTRQVKATYLACEQGQGLLDLERMVADPENQSM